MDELQKELEGLSLEEAFQKLDELIEKMGERDLPLETSFQLYKQGLTLVEYCNSKIEKVECDIKKITE